MNFKKLNNLVGWLAFGIALVAYTMTVEPTASFWDCGEFIACAYKLQVPHPSGAPLFLLLGRMASFFAGGDVTKVALMVNMVSVIASAFTILFMFWTISLLARKIYGKKGEELDNAQIIMVLGSSLVGSLIYAFSDSFWFSAVEAEVYGMSSFFTAIVVWAAFRWELIEDESASNRWLIFIAYLVGLSIGVHLLNLVTIPSLALLYYYKKTKTVTWKGGIIAFLAGMVVLAIVNTGVITEIPSIGFAIEKLFVNTFGLPFSSGLIFFVIALIGALVYGIIYTQRKGKVLANTALVSFAFILIGYSTYTIALIRSNYNPPINENNPSNVLNYVSYLKREQYGSRPLLFGPIYTAKLTDIKPGEPVYKQGKDKYEIYDTRPEYVWDNAGNMLLPRVWSQDPSHIARYRSILNIPDGQKPSMGDNLTFMFKHQFGTMYWRYFLWNFWGRASDIEGSGAVNITESSKALPPALKDNRGRTNFFALPIILGILGLLFQYFRRERDFIITLLLFLFTGLALSVFLNSPPIEPRERDYIFVGSFYFFAIWAGLGVMAIGEYVLKFLKNKQSNAIAATVISLAVPAIMLPQVWKGHDRSNRYHQVDFARNLLNSCEKNAVLFTGGDNDTFPLWYVQEVEGFRTDVRVCNLSLLGTDWYIQQMKRKTYESDALPVTFENDQILSGINDQIPFVKNSNPQIQAGINLKDYLSLVKSNDAAIQMPITTGESINTLISSNLFLNYDVEAVKKLGFVDKKYEANLTGQMLWNIGERDLLKNDLIVLDIIAHNEWKRPIYFSGTLSPDSYLNLKEYFQLEGYAYRLMPFKVEGAKDGFVNANIMYNNVMKKMFWRELDNPKVYYDSETYLKVPIITARFSFLRLADELVREGDKKRAKEVLDYGNKVIPDKSIPYDQLSANYILFYFEIGDVKSAMQIAETIANRSDENLKYFIEKNRTQDNQWGNANLQEFIGFNLRNLQMVGNICQQYHQDAAAKKFTEMYNKHYSKLE